MFELDDKQVTYLMSIKDPDKFVDALADTYTKLVNKHNPYIIDANALINDTPNGVVRFEIKVYNGIVQSGVFTQVLKHNYNKDYLKTKV